MHEDCARAKANVHYTLSSPRAAFFTRLNTTPFLRRRDPGPFSSLRGDRHPLEASERLSHGFHARNWTGRIPGFKGRPNTVRCIAGKAHGRTIDKAIAHTITREFVILSLESLKETSPAFPPLQGAIGGLLKLVNTYEMMTQNVPYRQRLYERIDKIQDDLIFAWKDFDIRTCSLSDLQVRALESFEISIQHILDDANAILNSGMNPLRRFILAREHRSQLSDLVLRLANADDDFRRLIELDTNARITKMQLTSSEESAIIHRKLHDIQTLHARLFIFIPILFARDSGVGDTKIISCIVRAFCTKTRFRHMNPSIVQLAERLQSIACPGSLARERRLCRLKRYHHLPGNLLRYYEPRLRGNRKAPDKGVALATLTSLSSPYSAHTTRYARSQIYRLTRFTYDAVIDLAALPCIPGL